MLKKSLKLHFFPFQTILRVMEDIMRNSSRSVGLEMQSSQVYFLLKLLLIRRQINAIKDNFLMDSNKNVSFSFIRGIGVLFFLLNRPAFWAVYQSSYFSSVTCNKCTASSSSHFSLLGQAYEPSFFCCLYWAFQGLDVIISYWSNGEFKVKDHLHPTALI